MPFEAKVRSMPKDVVWHGTSQELSELLQVLGRNCQYHSVERGARTCPCPVHHMYVADQRALDGLLFARHQMARLVAQEFHCR
jgi:hypothetical protein